ncbi:MAG: hypothetical protein SNJ29_09920 [Rikenellaceae bacterium]
MKQRRITQQDYLKAHRKASREEEIATFGKQVTHRTKVQKSKKAYDRTGHKAALKKLPFFIPLTQYYPQWAS